ncbi:MAG: hypothetical protein GX633_01760, partial [Clostridiales bacterium]|nr:hypothetical protein [Clostridiales bacterium]
VGMDGESTQRLVRTGAVPSTIINYIHPLDTALDYAGSFIGSPTITKLPPGDLLACTDIFGGAEDMGLVFKSSDGGESWRYVTELISCQWPRPFVLK